MHGKILAHYFNIIIILSFFLMLSGCQASESLPEPKLPDVENEPRENGAIYREDKEVADEEIENASGLEIQEIIPNTLLTLSFTAGDFIISANGSLLYFTIPSVPGTLYHVIDLTAAEIDSQTTPEIEWEAIEPLPTPSIIGNTYHLQINADGSNLLYATA